MTLLKKTYLFTLLILLFSSCNKERNPLSWNIDLIAPVVYGDLTIRDLLKDTMLSINSDHSIQLKFSSNVYRLDFDSIVKIPDTTFKTNYTIPFSAGITFSPGQTFISQPEDNVLGVDGAELVEFKVGRGAVNYSLRSNIEAEIIYEYKIANAFNEAGESFSKTVVVPAANSSNSTVSGTFSLVGYTIPLTGVNQNWYNTLSTSIDVTLSSSHPNDLLLSNQDSIFIENTLSNIQLAYARGYFGHQVLPTVTETSKITQMNSIIGGGIDLEQVSVDFKVINGIGVDAAFEIQNLTSVSSSSVIPLVHPIIGSENHINRAFKVGETVSPTVFSNQFTSSNSNIENWIENLPDSVLYGINLELNPLGNVSGHNDFVYANSPFEVNMDIDMPLSFLANDLKLVDTITIGTEKLEQLIKGKLKIQIENGFPLEAQLSVRNSRNNRELFSSTIITSATIDNNEQVTASQISNHEVTLQEEDVALLRENNQLIILITFNSPPATNLIAIYDSYHLKFNVLTDFTYQNSIK